MSISVACKRLVEERKDWRKDHPHFFSAKPERSEDGLVNLMVWHCTIPGLPTTDWEGGSFPITMYFSEAYPFIPPECRFPPHFFHPNVYPSGRVCLSILDPDKDWKSCITVKQILFAIQHLLNNPRPEAAAQPECSQILLEQPDEYSRRVKEQASRYPLQI